MPLLRTKLYIPPLRHDQVPRPHLVERLHAGLHHKLTLISAPAGFGKTTLVSEWVHTLDKATPPIAVAWLSLDESDNDPARFLTYLIAAVQVDDRTEKGMLSALQSGQPPPVEAILTTLINEIAALPDRVVLILDDYHLIDAQPVHDALTFLLRHLPPGMHLVIATREDPPLPLARLRARGQLTELRAMDLRFMPSEAAQFLNQVMGLNLSAGDVDAMEARTEGWIAGLQLAAISMQGRQDVAGFIQAFTGSHHFVLDYLVEEVLAQQSESVQSFLRRTSILDRLTGSLCDALTGQEDGSTELRGASCRDTASGQATLEMLERANLFIVPLDDERQWYRYHHLFADLLRQQLQRTESHLVPRLHHQASIWLEQNGFLDEAIKHALLANDFTRSAVLIADLADPLWKRGEHVKLRLWLAKLPEEALCVQPKLCIYQAWFLFSTGQQEPAQQLLQVVEQNIDSGRDDTRLRGWLGAIWSQISYWKEDIPGIARYGGWAIEYLPPGDPWRNMAATALGDARYYQGDVQAAYQTRLETLAASRPEDDLFFYMVANLKVASSLRALAKLNQVIEICRQQLEFATRHGLLKTVFVGWALAIWAVVLAEQNELDQALEFAHQSLELNLGGDYALLRINNQITPAFGTTV
jgi:LuxR family maltose regulon positive regulatory protein